MKNLISYFIKFPVAVNVILLAFIGFGFMGLRNLTSSFFPLFPTTNISINIIYPGASPEEIEEGIVLKIEDNLRGVIGIDRVTSVSSENSALITVETFEDYDIDVILQEVKNAVDRVPNFPADMEPPVIAKQEPLNEVISFTVSGTDVPLRTLKQIARSVEDDIRAMGGISQIRITGFPAEEIEIAVRESDLRAYGLTFDEVARAVANANILTTGGNIKTRTEEYLIRANARNYYGDELDFIVVKAEPDGLIIHLKDVATIRDKWSESPDRLYYDGKTAVQIQVLTTNNEDFLKASDKITQYIDDFNLRQSNVRLDVTNDQSITLRQRTKLLLENGGIGILLVLILLSLFLKPSLAFWVATGIPVSFFGMFIFAHELITINVMSLFGMIVVIGILVDDGIVIGENIYYHYEQGKKPIRAAIDGTLEVLPPVISAVLTTVVAFSLFFFLDGRVGDFYSEVATVVVITLGISLIEAVIILPSHLAHSRGMNRGKKGFLLNRWADSAIVWVRDKLYGPVLKFFLENRLFGFAVPASLLILTFGAIGSGFIRATFFPNVASDRVTISLEMPQGTSEQVTDSLISRIENATWSVNEDFTRRQTENRQVIQNVVKRIGPGTSQATLTLNLLPGELRDFPASDISNAVQEKVGEVYGVENLTYGAGVNLGGQPVSISLVGNDISQLKAAKEELKTKLKANPRLKDVSDNDPEGIKEIRIQLKDNAYLLGLTLNEVMTQVRSAFFGASVQRFQRGRDEVRVWVRYDRQERESIKNLDDMRIVTPGRDRVPFSEIANYTIERGEVAINHLNGIREIKVEADLKKRNDSSTEILADIQDNLMPGILSKYPTVTPLYEGQNREVNKISSSAKLALPVVLFLIYAIIAFTFRSYSQPILLFLMIPFSFIGVAWGHWIHGQPISLLSILGIIALIGILVNDGLVLVGKFNGFLRDGMEFNEALFEAGKSRFRAIFLTSITTMAGLAPLIFETSRQAQFLIPMAISIAYGIFIATFMTLLLLPIFLSYNNSIKVYRRWLFSGRMPSREEMERAIREQKAEQDALDEIN